MVPAMTKLITILATVESTKPPKTKTTKAPNTSSAPSTQATEECSCKESKILNKIMFQRL